jgi:hypothetical protein
MGHNKSKPKPMNKKSEAIGDKKEKVVANNNVNKVPNETDDVQL